VPHKCTGSLSAAKRLNLIELLSQIFAKYAEEIAVVFIIFET
jgi:hypothetical protein